MPSKMELIFGDWHLSRIIMFLLITSSVCYGFEIARITNVLSLAILGSLFVIAMFIGRLKFYWSCN
ncbi:MAG: hypothetical protein ACFFDF_04065 [Candidatus Odinarchaeota archaeon]